MYNPIGIISLGMACGAAIVLCALLARWLRRQDADLSLYQQSQQGYFFGRLRLCAARTRALALEGLRASHWPSLTLATRMAYNEDYQFSPAYRQRPLAPERVRK